MPKCLLVRLLTVSYGVKKWGSYGSIQDRLKVYENCIKVSKIDKSVQDYSMELHLVKLHSAELCSVELRSDSNLQFHNPLFRLKIGLKKSIAGMGV